jgi:uncharacterized membrane protein (UPF0127 family)
MLDPCGNSGRLLIDGRGTGLRVRMARSFPERARGLLGWRLGADFDALMLCRCSSVHTLGMSRAIDLCFVTAEGRVIKVRPHLAPWRFAACRGAAHTLELAEGAAVRLGVSVGATLSMGDSK